MSRWIRRLSPVLLGGALVLMLHGDQLAAFALAVAFFLVYVFADPPRRREPEPAQDEGEPEAS